MEDSSAANGEGKHEATSSKRRIHKLHNHEDNCLLQMCDTTYHCVPAHVCDLFQHFELAKMTNGEILFQLVYLMAIETGFGECGSLERCAQQLHRHKYIIPAYFDAWNAQCLSQQKPQYSVESANTIFGMLLQSTAATAPDTETCNNKSLSFKLTGIVTGDGIIITITPLREGLPVVGHPAQSIFLSILRYIVGMPQRSNRPLQQHLNKIPELANKLRVGIFLPVQQYLLPLIGIERFPALTGLPVEVYDNIFHCLNGNQLRMLANVCKRLNRLVRDSKHFKRDPWVAPDRAIFHRTGPFYL